MRVCVHEKSFLKKMKNSNHWNHKNNHHNHHRNGGNGTTGTNTTTTTTNLPNPDIKNHDLLAVRAYITAADHNRYHNTDPDCVIIDLTHSNLLQKHIEIRFYKHDTISTLRRIIYRKTGTSDHNQHLQIYDIDQRTLLHDLSSASLDQCDNYKLGYFDLLYHGMRVHCIDMNPYSLSRNGGLEDVTLIPKYKLTDEKYDAKQSGTLRSWARTQQQQQQQQQQQNVPAKPFSYELHRQKHEALMNATRLYKLKLPLPVGYMFDEKEGRVIVDPTYVVVKDHEVLAIEKVHGPDSVQHVTIMDRCQIQPGKRRGQVVWIGTFQEVQPPPEDDIHHNNNSNNSGSCSNHKNNNDDVVDEVGTMMNTTKFTTPLPPAPVTIPHVPQTTIQTPSLGQRHVVPGGYWVGVQLDEPTGKNDGRIHGIRYFTTSSSYGAFVRGKNIKTGPQYVVRDIMNDDDSSSSSSDEDDDSNSENSVSKNSKNDHHDPNDSDDADEI